MARSFVITNGDRTRRMVSIINAKQNGLCYFCRTKIEEYDVIVSHGHMSRHYSHKKCALRLHII
jgi:hypothetical protein